jgi:choline dehydrogenase
MFVMPAPSPHPVAKAIVEAAASLGIPSYHSNNGAMMDGDGGASIADVIIRDGRRQSVFRSYVSPHQHRSNLTVLTGATVTRLSGNGNRIAVVEFSHGGATYSVAAAIEVVVSLGAINTPKVLMQSGIGDADKLRHFGLPVVAHLPGVGQNYQSHPRVDCVWQFRERVDPCNNGAEAMVFWKSDPRLEAPDLQICVAEVPLTSAANADKYDVPEHGWTACTGVLRPKSRGQIRLTGPDPDDRVLIEDNMLSHDDDVVAAMACVDLSREIGNSAPLQPFTKGEVLPGDLSRIGLERFVRDAAECYFHQSCTAKMGRDDMSVVDADLKVYGVEGLRIADASIMPRITTGNTMAPCVVIGERASDILKGKYGL